MDYNKLPGYLFWSLHLVWLFPWALFLGALIHQAYGAFQRYTRTNPLPIADRAVVVVGILLRDRTSPTLHRLPRTRRLLLYELAAAKNSPSPHASFSHNLLPTHHLLLTLFSTSSWSSSPSPPTRSTTPSPPTSRS
jgi:hypothetical protein